MKFFHGLKIGLRFRAGRGRENSKLQHKKTKKQYCPSGFKFIRVNISAAITAYFLVLSVVSPKHNEYNFHSAENCIKPPQF
jgi:hypothetical protein